MNLKKLNRTLNIMEESLDKILTPLSEKVNLKQLSRIVSEPAKWIRDFSMLGTAEIEDANGAKIQVTSPGQILNLLYSQKLLPQDLLVKINNLIKNKQMTAAEAMETVGSADELGALLKYFVANKVTSSAIETAAKTNPELSRQGVHQVATNRTF